MKGNHLETFPVVGYMPKLKTIDLSNNLLKGLADNATGALNMNKFKLLYVNVYNKDRLLFKP